MLLIFKFYSIFCWIRIQKIQIRINMTERLYIRGTLRGIRNSQLAKIPPLYNYWLGIKKRFYYLSCMEGKGGLKDNHCIAQIPRYLLIYYKTFFDQNPNFTASSCIHKHYWYNLLCPSLLLSYNSILLSLL